MAHSNSHTTSKLTDRDVTLRVATQGDSRSLLRLAALDDRPLPAGPFVVAEVDGELVAAVSVSGGSAIADPFRRTAVLVQMLELRAREMRPAPRPAAPVHGRLRHLLAEAHPVQAAS